MSIIYLNSKSIGELLALYNETAAAKGEPTVKRFADRTAALKRTTAMLGIEAGAAAPASELPAGDTVTEAAPNTTGNNPNVGDTTGGEKTTTTTTTETGGETANNEGDDDMKKAKKAAAKQRTAKKAAKKIGAKKAAKAKAAAKKALRDEVSKIGKGSNRDKLLTRLEKNMGEQVAISKLKSAVYGSENANNKEFTGPLMMVMKGLLIVFKTQKMKLEIRKTRENKENYFGLYKKA